MTITKTNTYPTQSNKRTAKAERCELIIGGTASRGIELVWYDSKAIRHVMQLDAKEIRSLQVCFID